MSSESKEQLKLMEEQLVSSQALLESRAALYQRIGSNIVGPNGKEPTIKEEDNPLKVGLARESVDKSQLRILAHVIQLESSITNLRLIDSAEDFLELRTKKETELRELRRLSQHLSPHIIEREEEKFRELITREETDEELRKGLQLLEERRKQKEEEEERRRSKEEEQRKTPKITINRVSGEVIVDILDVSKHARLPERDIDILAFLAAKQAESVSTQVLTQRIRELGSNTANPASTTVRSLRASLEPDPRNPQVILSFGISSGMRYQLRGNVEFVEETPQRVTSGHEKDKGLRPTLSTRLDALQAMIELPDVTLTPIVDLLGPDKNGRSLHWATALHALINSIRNLHTRVSHNVASPEELKVWGLLQDLTQERRNEKIVRKTNAWIEKWFHERRPAPSSKNTELVEIGEARLGALKLVMENPNATITDVISVLPKTKQGRDFTFQQAKVSVPNTIRRIYSRVLRGVMTVEEQQLWNEVKDFAGGNYSDEKTTKLASEKLRAWFEEKKLQ